MIKSKKRNIKCKVIRRIELEAIEEFEEEKQNFEKNVLKRTLARGSNKYVNDAIEEMDEESKKVFTKDMLDKLIAESPQLRKETEETLLKQFELIKEKRAKGIEEQKDKIKSLKEQQEQGIRDFVRKKIEYIKETQNADILEADNSYDDITFFENGERKKVVLKDEDKKNLEPGILTNTDLQKFIEGIPLSKKKLEEMKDEVNTEKVRDWESSLRLKFAKEKVAQLNKESRDVASSVLHALIRRVLEVVSIREDKIEYIKHFGDYLTDRKLRLDHLEHQKVKSTMAKLISDDFLESSTQNFVKEIAEESYGLAAKVI